MNHKKLDFDILNELFRYCPETGSISNRIDRKGFGRLSAGAGEIATTIYNKGYLVVRFTKNGCRFSYLAHRVAWLLHTGEDPGEFQIDHIDQDTTNNQFSNLRLVDYQENLMNKGKYKTNISGITGVCWHKRDGKWQAQISDCGKPQSLGYFEDFFEACCARKSAENRLGYHPNHGK